MSFAELERRLLETLVEQRQRGAPFATPFDSQWRRLDAESAAHWLASTAVELARQGQERPALLRYRITGVRAFKPAFYDGVRLLECWAENREGRYGALYYLEFRDQLFPMLGQSSVIHHVNGEQEFRLQNASDAAEYLRFFCWFTWGEQGPFVVSDDPRMIYWQDGAGDDLRQRVERQLLPVQVTEVRPPSKDWASSSRETTGKQPPSDGGSSNGQPGDPAARDAEQDSKQVQDAKQETKQDAKQPKQPPQSTFLGDISLIYERGLFRAAMKIEASGMVQMTDDTLLEGDLPVLNWFKTPHGAWFQHADE